MGENDFDVPAHLSAFVPAKTEWLCGGAENPLDS